MSEIDNVFKVHEVTTHIKNMLEKNIGILQIEGEVSNLSKPISGHLYFSLKDEKSLIRCVFFAGYNRQLDFVPKNGDKVVVTGKITVYERDGQYQVIISKIVQYGIGFLHARFEQLKEKLKAEGLFRDEIKKKLPQYPRSIGIVTSETGAALQDMLNILSRRYPIDVFLYPAVVQGAEAPASLIAGIRYFSQNMVDVIIIGRGGGSYEDLFCFNDEALARAIYQCPVPVISAVGHEIDFTICDFVADVRAATPSVAAELATPNRSDIIGSLIEKNKRLQNLISMSIHEYHKKVLYYDKSLKSYHPSNIIARQRLSLNYHANRLAYLMNDLLGKAKHDIERKMKILEGYSPTHIIEKGFSIIIKDGKMISSKENLHLKDQIDILLKDGKCKAEII